MTIRVLLADDHAVLRDGLRALLTRTPDLAVVGEAANGREAVQRAVELRPDVLIMDISMPELNGVEAARLVHERCPATRVIFLSMHADAEHVYRALDAGASGYLLKESAGAEILDAVHAVAVGKRFLGAGIAVPEAGRRAVSPLDSLSIRERQVLQLVAEGKSSAEIARIVHLSPKTVETYRSRIMKKLGVSDVPALVKFAVQHGITPPG